MWLGGILFYCCYFEDHIEQAEKLLGVEFEPATFRFAIANALPTELRGQVGSSVWYFGTQSNSFDICVGLKNNILSLELVVLKTLVFYQEQNS